MSNLRDKCEHKARCGATGHFLDNGMVRRCPCLTLEINQRRLGPMFTTKPKDTTKLEAAQDQNCVFHGPLEQIRQHVARVLINRAEKGEPWNTIDVYRLIEVFLGQDSEFESQAAIRDSELLILLVGFGDPRNRYLPELLLQTLSARELIRKPTWVILGIQLEQVAGKYSEAVHERLKNMKQVKVN